MPAGNRPNVTLIARKCGLSKMTVSRVLRNKGGVAPATRRRVLEVAERSGFVPKARAAEGTAQARTCCVLFQKEHSLKDAFFSGIILSIQDHLFRRGFSCSLGIIGEDYPAFLKLANMLNAAGGVGGVFIVGECPPSYINGLQAGFPCLVLIDYPGSPEIARPYNAVCVDNVYGAHLAMRHLLKLGRRRILLLCGREGHYFTEDLKRGYAEALAAGGVAACPELTAYADFHVQGGYRAVRQVLAAGAKFDAIFSNDEMACGAMKALAEAGVRVPADVSVVGFDGLPMGQAVSPSLTTVEVDRAELGRLAVERFLAFADGPLAEPPCEKISIFPRLVVRSSCGAAGPDAPADPASPA